jgi:ribosomal protein S18 acetylase RimI-like enzyme
MIIRDYKDTDLQGLAAVHSASKQVAEKGIIFDEDLAIFTPDYYKEKWAEWSQFEESSIRVAVSDDKVLGFCSFGRVKTRPSFDKGVVPRYGGEIYALYVHPDYFDQGIGKALFLDACQHLVDQKLTTMLLWAMKKNKRACAFYDKMGGERVGKKKIEIGTRSWAEESCFGWRDIRKVLKAHG